MTKLCARLFLMAAFCFSQWANAGLDIVTSIKPLQLLLAELVAPGDQVSVLLDSGRSPHHYQLTVSDRQKLDKADLVIWIGADLESFLSKALSTRSAPQIVASKVEGIHWPQQDGVEKKDVKKEHAHSNSHSHNSLSHNNHEHSKDPHLWLDPHNLGVLTQALNATLQSLAPDLATTYSDNSKRLLARLEQLNQDLEGKMSLIKDKPFIVLHPAYGHFVERYQLNQQDFLVITPERGIGAKHLYQLQKSAAVCVFGEEGEDGKLVNKISQSIDARQAMLDPLGIKLSEDSGATSILEALSATIFQCLKGK